MGCHFCFVFGVSGKSVYAAGYELCAVISTQLCVRLSLTVVAMMMMTNGTWTFFLCGYKNANCAVNAPRHVPEMG